jgi:hypothetical protein
MTTKPDDPARELIHDHQHPLRPQRSVIRGKISALHKRFFANAVWRTKPSWMLVAGNDRTINPELERW